ncbi:MAG: hypothetical protein MZV70_23555 [Desulfobacterales bacterium]|nr:hypothetical protein [Desulfobacterales bacterium]
MRTLVDVLTLSATPIPRTLHLSLVGIRDLSIINTPPEDRQPIKTYVLEFDEDTIKAAIEAELARGGQVFFVHDRVRSIYSIAHLVQRLVPQARVGVVHGQMKPADIEKAMSQFIRREFDVLVCTTIIGSGLDIPSANTIHHQPRRPLRPGPALPDSRPRGPGQSGSLRLSAAAQGRAAVARRHETTSGHQGIFRTGFRFPYRLQRSGNPRGRQSAGPVAGGTYLRRRLRTLYRTDGKDGTRNQGETWRLSKKLFRKFSHGDFRLSSRRLCAGRSSAADFI